MEEKKLTDREIVKTLEWCIAHRENCNLDCGLENLPCDDDGFIVLIIDLIHRLQSENAEQKAEIERLTEENEAIRINCENARNIAGQMFDKNDELQKQIELKKGKWLNSEKAFTSFVCSECGGEPMYSPDKKGKAYITITQFCPSCGAKMDFMEGADE